MASENEQNPLEQLHAARQQVTQLTSEREHLRGQIAQLTTDRDSARAQLGGAQADVTRLTASQASFDQRLANELAKHGIRTFAVQAEVQQPGAKMLTLTEQCLAATQGKEQISR